MHCIPKRIGNIIILVFLIVFNFGHVSASQIISKEPASSSTFNSTPQDCASLDVVFIVDQSWTMSAPGTMEAADPHNERKYAVEAMVDLLTGLALDQCPGTHHRMGVISYGSKPRVDLPLTDIAPETASEANALRDQGGIIKKRIVADDMGANNPLPAFDQAYQMLRAAADIRVAGQLRKKVIIFLTNGVPHCNECSKDPADETTKVKDRVNKLFPFDSTLLQLETCLADLRKEYPEEEIPPERTSQCLANYRPDQSAYDNSVYLWTVYLQPPGYDAYQYAYRGRVITSYEEMSRLHAGSAIELQSNSINDIPVTFRTILSSLAGVRPVLLQCSNFAMNPYLRQARITVYSISEENRITLAYQDVSGNRFEIKNGQPSSPGAFDLENYYEFGTNESYILNFPYPGIWSLTAENCNGLDVYYEKVEITSTQQIGLPAQIPQYEVAPFYDPEDPVYLTYQMRDTFTGTVVQQAAHPRFAIEAQATVTGPNGTIEYPMVWEPTSQSFRASEPLQVPSPGEYSVHIVGQTYTRDANPSPLESIDFEQVFPSPLTLFDITTKVNVFPVTPFKVEVIEPVPGGTITPIHENILDGGWPLKIKPLRIRIRLLDRDGNPIDNPQDYLASTESAFTAQLFGNGKNSERVTLKPAPDTPGYFEGEIPNFEISGSQTVKVEMAQSAMLEDKRPYDRIVEANFSRVDSLWTQPAFYPALLVLLVVVSIASMVYNISIRTNKISGNLIFKDGMTTIAEFNLASGKNWRIISSRELDQYPQLMLKQIKAVNVKAPKVRRKSTEEIGIDTASFSDEMQKQIRLFCISENNRRFSIDLEPNLPVHYGDESFAQMVYEPLE